MAQTRPCLICIMNCFARSPPVTLLQRAMPLSSLTALHHDHGRLCGANKALAQFRRGHLRSARKYTRPLHSHSDRVSAGGANSIGKHLHRTHACSGCHGRYHPRLPFYNRSSSVVVQKLLGSSIVHTPAVAFVSWENSLRGPRVRTRLRTHSHVLESHCKGEQQAAPQA